MHKALQLPSTKSAPKRRKGHCNVCNNLDSRGHPNTGYHVENKKRVGTSLTLVLDGLTLRKSRDHGCGYCILLCQALDAIFKEWQTSRGRISVDLAEKVPIRVFIDGLEFNGAGLEVYAPSGSRTPWPTLGSTHDIPLNSGSDESFNFVRRSIEDCLTNPKHSACRVNSKHAPPKRLLDVGRIDKPIKLCEPRGKDMKYVTLSHCWGSGPLLTTTTENIHSWKSFIPWESLPPLFQDAVIITRQLGMRYVWIDSLCIIQDSKSDWECESAKMSGIYENSYVTVAAATSGDSDTHCLTDRCKPVKLQYQNAKGKAFSIKARKVQNHHPNASERTPARPGGPLVTRSWALQEHVLCSRIFHYTSTELLFECKTAFRCECMPTPKRLPTTPALISKMLSTGRKRNVWMAWHRIITQYTTRKLTVSSDKLPAISGIAAKIQLATNSEYLAGLWVENLAHDLLWSSDPSLEPPHTAHRLGEWRAPSFSWASVDTQVQYYEPEASEGVEVKSNVDILVAWSKLAGLNSLGEVIDGHIILRGPVMEGILITPNENDFSYQLLVKSASMMHVSPDTLLIEDDVEVKDQTPKRTVRRALPGETLKPFKTTVFCLNVASYSDEWVSGLVLGFSPRVPGSYERLGVFSAGFEFFQKAEQREITLV
ncbi:HET-domain-containing protein [Lepidopterella palustris CBS 459.81]|uniref:HET-domain-containing protein n=1 Tax=Lepidopterella palustris CBS 459.81 TaxID=1314670 RepID=A0A8E2E2C5_9PEZI|nr:HET-domain-containing protein [Lepidopterella palustris CBS 459.81]